MTYKEAIKTLQYILDDKEPVVNKEEFENTLRLSIKALERCQQVEEQFEWCHECKEYDQEKHCCHRFNKRIRETLSEIEEHYKKLCKKQEKLANYIDTYRNSNGRYLVMKSDVIDLLESLVVEE